MTVEPGFKGEPSGESERGGNNEVLEQLFKGGPVG